MNEHKSTTITIANSKGGVGKTTCTAMMSYLLQKMNYKVLTIDYDPQGDCTKFLYKSMNYDYKNNEKKSFFQAITEQNLEESIVTLSDNLDIIPADRDLLSFERHLFTMTQNVKKHAYLFDYLLTPLKDQYDFILIDVPPTTSEKMNNAVTASDYVLIVLQTHQNAFEQTLEFIDYIREMEAFNSKLDIIGIVPYLIKKDGKVDNAVMEEAKTRFDNILFDDSSIYNRERVKLFSREGIKNEDHHDKKVLEMYQGVVNNILESLKK